MPDLATHTPSRSILLNAPDPLKIRGLLSDSRLIDANGFNLAVHHTIESTRVLRNLGYDAPAPIRNQYRWPGIHPPMDQQIAMADFQVMHRRAFNLSEPGTCKTAAALWATDYLMDIGKVKKTLVLCPLSIVETTWQKDIYETLLHRRCVILRGSKRLQYAKLNVDFFILNHDGVKIEELAKVIRTNPDITQIIIDEGDEFRNSRTEKYKSLKRLIREDQRVWWMTGTPLPNGPTDAWAQAKIINPRAVPEYYGHFQIQTMMKVTQYKWVPRPEGTELAFKALQPAIRFKKSDCLDLPPVTTEDRQSELTKEQRDNFNQMKSRMAMETKGKKILAANAADQITKLRQVLAGVVKDPITEEYVEIAHEPRFNLLLEAIKTANAKTYVVVPFKGIIRALARQLTKHYSVGVLNGDVSAKERARIVTQFKTTPDPHVLLCHPKVTSHGLNFVEADTLVLYAPIYSNSQFQQVIERFNRPGQTRSMRIIRIGAHPLEWDIYRAVDNRRTNQDNILNLYKTYVDQSVII